MKTEVLVIGGGILGSAAAYYLSKRGEKVVVVDNGALPGQATAATTAGLTMQNRTAERLPFYHASAKMWPSLTDELEYDLGYTRSGSLTLAHTAAEYAELKRHAESLQPVGLEVSCLTTSEAQAIAPWVAGDIAGATYCPSDGFMEPDRPLRAFQDAAVRQGATFLSHSPVRRIEHANRSTYLSSTDDETIESRVIVNAAGAWAGQVAALVGLTLPVTLDPLQAMATEPSEPWLDMVVLHANKKLTVKQNRNGRIVIGGGWRADGDLDGLGIGLQEAHYDANLKLAQRSVPHLKQLSIEQTWVGLEGRSPDRLPFFGEAGDIPGFYMLACVHGGVTMSPLLGANMAELITDGRTTFPMRDFICRDYLPLTNLNS